MNIDLFRENGIFLSSSLLILHLILQHFPDFVITESLRFQILAYFLLRLGPLEFFVRKNLIKY